MTYLEIMRDVAKNAGIEMPATVTALEPNQVKMGQFINEAGREIARRVDWGSLREVVTLTGDGTAGEMEIAPDFDRFPEGLAVVAAGAPVRGSLTSDEWFSLEPVEGKPRYFYLQGGKVGLYPFLASGQTVRVQYQSKFWVAEGGAKSADAMTKDDDETPLDGNLIVSGAVWRWRRHAGKDFADYLSEFEAMLTDVAEAHGGVRAP